MIAGISVSVTVLAVLLAAVLWLIWRKRAGDFLIYSFLTTKNSSDLTLMISRQARHVQIVCYYRNVDSCDYEILKQKFIIYIIHFNDSTKYPLLWNLNTIIIVNILCFACVFHHKYSYYMRSDVFFFLFSDNKRGTDGAAVSSVMPVIKIWFLFLKLNKVQF